MQTVKHHITRLLVELGVKKTTLVALLGAEPLFFCLFWQR